MSTVIHFKEEESLDRLTSLGLNVEWLINALNLGYLGWASCTANDPLSYPGTTQVSLTIRGLRENLIPQGWLKCDRGNYPRIISPNQKMAIAVTSGCSNTGKPNALPSNRNPKGSCTIGVVETNSRQLNLAFPGQDLSPQEEEMNPKLTWILLFYRDKEELRAELSLPAEMDKTGYIRSWVERIILPTQPLNNTPPVIPEFGPDITIEVRKRA